MYGIDGLVRVPRNPAVKARHVNLVDEIGIERRVGIGWRDANRVRRKMGEHDGARAVAELLNKAKLGVEALDVVFGFGAALVRRFACGDVEKSAMLRRARARFSRNCFLFTQGSLKLLNSVPPTKV